MNRPARPRFSGAQRPLDQPLVDIAQPSLSQFLRKVEERVGQRLFERRRDGLELTFVGRQYLEYAQRILRMERDFESVVRDYGEGESGQVSIGVPPVRSAYILPRVLPVFRRKYPRIEPLIVEGSNAQVHEMVEKGGVDAGFLHLPVESGAISCDKLFQECILLAVPPNHPLAKKFPPKKSTPVRTIDPRLIGREPFILLRQGQRVRAFSDTVFKSIGCRPDVVLETSSNTTAERLAYEGLGLTFVVDSLTKTIDPAQACRYFHLSGIDDRWTIALCRNRDRYLSKAARAFLETCRAVYRQPAPRPPLPRYPTREGSRRARG